MSDIVWEDPPKTGRSSARGRHTAIAAELKARPGEWAKVLVDTNLSQSSQIRNGLYKAYQPAGSFEAVARNARNVDGRVRCDIYARYVGGEATK
jgi:hypothetical protein